MDELRETQMQNQMQMKPTDLSLRIVSIVAAINSLVTLLIGALWVLIIEISEPSPREMKLDLESIAVQRDQEQLTVLLSVGICVIIYLIALVFWINGKRFWDFILLGLTLLHLVGLYYLVISFFGYLPAVLFIPLALDLIILVTIIVDKRYSKVSINPSTG
jgi:uncharacterized membrane protein